MFRHSVGECTNGPLTFQIQLRSGTSKRLADDVLDQDLITEQASGDLGDVVTLLGTRSTAGHGRRGPNDLEGRRGARLAQAADEHPNVGPLPTTVGMELIEYQELQVAACRANQTLALARPGEDQLEHHVVGQDDVGRIGENRFPLLVGLLAGVAGVAQGSLAFGVAEVDELLQLQRLAVGQRVHWVHDQRTESVAGTVSQYPVDDWRNVGQRFARPCASRQHIVRSGAGGLDGLGLVPVEPQAASVIAVLRFGAEDAGAFRVQHLPLNQLVGRRARLEVGVQLDPRLGPQ